MAYAALVSLAQTIDKITLNHNQYPISDHRKKQMGSIHEKVILLQKFLDDFAEKANSLEGRITVVANGAEDILEHFMLEQIQSSLRSTKWTIFPANFKFILQLRKIRKNIDSMTGKMNNISTEMENVVRSGDSPAASSSSRLASASKNNDVVGLDDDLIAIISRLCGEPPKQLVIPIVGMGGIGKTTLARNVYDSPLVMQYFDIRAWVTVSEDDILSGLIVSLKLPNEETSGRINESDKEKVYKSLKGRRYLIVMDDMWSTQAWEEVAKNIDSAVATNNSQFEEILCLSYTHFPHYLRPCFLYMISFREDHELRVSKLIKLWVAEGFMKCQNGCKSLEEEAEECLEDLIKRSLVFVRKRKSNEKIKTCSLHDLMRDLFIRKAHEEKFLVNFSGGYIKKFHSAEDKKRKGREKKSASY